MEHRLLLHSEFSKAMTHLTDDLRSQTKETVILMEKKGLSILPNPAKKDLEAFHRIHGLTAEAFTGKVFPEELLGRVYRLLKRTP